MRAMKYIKPIIKFKINNAGYARKEEVTNE